jgi:CheY-like chemotaxis protein
MVASSSWTTTPSSEPSVGRLLVELGYVPHLTSDGEEAIEAYRRSHTSGRPFDAVILDLTVPGGMGGKETLRHLRTIDPAVRAIVSSGYSDDPVLADFHAHGFAAAAAKPYTLQEFGQVLAQVLNGDTFDQKEAAG